MSQSDAYFQFPIAVLQPDPYQSRKRQTTPPVVQKIVDYGLWAYGLALHDKCPEQIPELAECYRTRHNPAGVDKKGNYHQQILMAAANRLHVAVPDVSSLLAKSKKAYESYGTRGTQCRMRSDILWSAHNDCWPWLRFAVLCAVYAAIGDAKLKRINTRVIQALGAGYDSPKGVSARDLLPQSSVRYWIDQLWYHNLFCHCLRGHERWYSIRHPDDAALAVDVKRLPVTSKTKTPINVDG